MREWIQRLDVGGNASGRRIYVYDVQHDRAEVLAESLKDVFGIGGGAYDSNPAKSGAAKSPLQSQAPASGDGENLQGFEGLGMRIVPNASNNSILVLASPNEYSAIQAALKRMDRPALQVLIEATLAEITLNDELKFGVQWEFLNDGNITTLSQNGSGAVSQSFPGFSYLHTGTDFIASLNALDSITDVQVISSPRLMILNNQEAKISVGDQVPILTQQAVSAETDNARVVNSVSQRDTGVILSVQPRVNNSGMVTLDIAQEVSAVVPTTTSGIDSPTIQERSITSTVTVRDGESVILGGLISESNSTGKSGVPFLARIPVLGWLFGASTLSNQRTELIVFIRPRVVRDQSEMKALTEDLRSEFRRTFDHAQIPSAE